MGSESAQYFHYWYGFYALKDLQVYPVVLMNEWAANGFLLNFKSLSFRSMQGAVRIFKVCLSILECVGLRHGFSVFCFNVFCHTTNFKVYLYVCCALHVVYRQNRAWIKSSKFSFRFFGFLNDMWPNEVNFFLTINAFSLWKELSSSKCFL